MGIREAQKYLSNLHRRQGDPMLWPDYLTGLPDSHAIITKIRDAYPKLGKYAISYICIADLNSYLIKYGPDSHAEILQWAAAILKTTSDKYNCFVGSTASHDFIAVGKKSDMKQFLSQAEKIFNKKAETFYKKGDLNRKSILSFVRDGRTVTLGLMRLISHTIDEKTDIPREKLINYLEKSCISLKD